MDTTQLEAPLETEGRNQQMVLLPVCSCPIPARHLHPAGPGCSAHGRQLPQDHLQSPPASQGQLNFGQRGEAPMLGAGALYQVALVGLVLRSW